MPINFICSFRDQRASERLRYCRKLQAISSHYSETYGVVYISSVTAFAVDNIILGIYGIIKLHDELEFDKLMNFPLMIAIMILSLFTLRPKLSSPYESTKGEAVNSLRITLMNERSGQMTDFEVRRGTATESDADIQVETNDTLTMGKENGWKWHKLVTRSCPALGVPFGSFSFIKRSTLLTLFDFTACNAVSALIAYP